MATLKPESLSGPVAEFLAALGFLTRLAPGRALRPEDLGRTLWSFPLIGLAVGLVASLPLWTGTASAHPTIQAWVVAGLSVWVTRGLHLDGLADIADAWGSGATGPRFWEILKDSRTGAFAVMALVMALLGQILLVSALAGQDRTGAVVFCFVWGRTCAVLLAGLARSSGGLHRPGLGDAFIRSATPQRVAGTLAIALPTGLLLAGFVPLLLACLFAAVVLAGLLRLGKRHGGLNGDFLGAAIVLAEIAALLAAMIAHS